jgi:hypothetical protein
MNCEELERLTKPELIDLLLGLQRPSKTLRTSSKPPLTDRQAKRDSSRPGGAKPGHKGHARSLAEAPDAHEDHRPAHCQHCGLPFVEDATAEVIGEYDEIDLPEVKPLVRQHRRMPCRCATCGKATSAPEAVVHSAVFSRAAHVVRDTMAGDQPDVWISDRYTGKRGHGLHRQTCLAHLDRKARFVEQHGSDLIGMRLKLWLDRAFDLARDIATLAAATVKKPKA